MCVLEGLPAGLALNLNDVEEDLRRRRQGHGRGGRMRICLDAHPSATTMPLSTAPQVLFHIIEIQAKASGQSLQHTHLAGPMGFTCSSQAEMGHALSSLQDRRPKAPLNSSPAFNYTAIASLQELLP